jgi:hypothetical protein
MRRVYRSGGFARVLAFSVGGLFLAAMGIGLTLRTAASFWKWPTFALLLIVFVALIVRAASVGVWISPAGLVVRSWFQTWRWPRENVRRCERVPYWGLLEGTGESRITWMLKFSLYDGTSVLVRSTIAPRRTSQQQVLELQSYLGN